MQLQTGHMGQFHTPGMLSRQPLHYMLLVTPIECNIEKKRITRKLYIKRNMDDQAIYLVSYSYF